MPKVIIKIDKNKKKANDIHIDMDTIDWIKLGEKAKNDDITKVVLGIIQGKIKIGGSG